MATFKVGDLVQLKSGGPPMTVEAIGEYSGMGVGPQDGVACVWFEKNKKEVAVFDARMLMLAQ